MSSDPVTGGVGAPRDEAGIDEAVEAAVLAMRQWAGAVTSGAWIPEARVAVEAAHPIIAAAVRADERAKVLREVERITEFHAMIQCPHGPKCDDRMCLGRREVASMFRALTTSGSGS